MNALVQMAHSLYNRVTFHQAMPEPEQIDNKPRAMTGFFAHLTPEQKAKALAYRGEENHGSDEHRVSREPA